MCYIALCRALLEFCSVTRRWKMHHFPFLSKGPNTWMLSRAGVPAWRCCSTAEPMLSSQESENMLSHFFFTTAEDCYTRRYSAQVCCGLIWNLSCGAEGPGVWNQPGWNCISQVPAGFSGALTNTEVQCDETVLLLLRHFITYWLNFRKMNVQMTVGVSRASVKHDTEQLAFWSNQ